MGLWSLVQGSLMLLNGVCILNNDRFLEPYGFGFSTLQTGNDNVFKSQVIHAIKWFQVMRTPLIPINVLVILIKLVFG